VRFRGNGNLRVFSYTGLGAFRLRVDQGLEQTTSSIQQAQSLTRHASGVSLISVAETLPFQRKAVQLLSEFEICELINHLSENPCAGVLMTGTGGIRKLRWAYSGRGKSGGVRVVYYFHSPEMPLYLLTLFGKNEKANLSMEEKNTLSKMVRELVKSWSETQ